MKFAAIEWVGDLGGFVRIMVGHLVTLHDSLTDFGTWPVEVSSSFVCIFVMEMIFEGERNKIGRLSPPFGATSVC